MVPILNVHLSQKYTVREHNSRQNVITLLMMLAYYLYKLHSVPPNTFFNFLLLYFGIVICFWCRNMQKHVYLLLSASCIFVVFSRSILIYKSWLSVSNTFMLQKVKQSLLNSAFCKFDVRRYTDLIFKK